MIGFIGSSIAIAAPPPQMAPRWRGNAIDAGYVVVTTNGASDRASALDRHDPRRSDKDHSTGAAQVGRLVSGSNQETCTTSDLTEDRG